MRCSSGQIYNPKTGRCIADSSANRRRLGKVVKKASRKASRKGSRKAVKKASRKGSRKAVKKSSKKASRKAVKKASRTASRKAVKKTSRKGSRKAVKKTSRKGSRKAVKKSSRKAKPTKSSDCKCSYKGDEPSPKGRGYCAHCAQMGEIMTGNDGNLWKATLRSNGSLYWKRA